LISKNTDRAARIVTPTATIGIRGTDFDARLCRGDCAKESSAITDTARPNAVQASAKVVQVQGEMTAADTAGAKRKLVSGGSVYPGELVETGNGAQAVLAFRDESKVTLGAATRFRVDNFVFDNKNPREGQFLVSLLRGSVRALTGLIAKNNNRNVRLVTPTATIGIRGTGFDAQCGDSGCEFFNWLGSITLGDGTNVLQQLNAGQGFFIGPSGARPITQSPLNGLPRPDGVNVNTTELFGQGPATDTDDGLFVFVRDGHIEVVSAREALQLGRGETGFAGTNGNLSRPATTPKFIDFDRTPMPNTANPSAATALLTTGLSNTAKVCK
jgi:hypothetical protein